MSVIVVEAPSDPFVRASYALPSRRRDPRRQPARRPLGHPSAALDVLASVPGRAQHRAYEVAGWRPRRLSGQGAGRRPEEPRGEGPEEKRGGAMATYEAYCVKCRTKREFEGHEVTLKNGRRAAQGQCPVCGTKVMRILGKAS
jgi:hypothetical protein